MTNKEFGKKMERRTLKFAWEIIKLSASIPYTQETRVVKYQLTKAGTSVGANYWEANRARSKADFYNKIKISESEASETVYWMELVRLQEMIKNTDLIFDEAKEILAILSAIINKLKSKK